MDQTAKPQLPRDWSPNASSKPARVAIARQPCRRRGWPATGPRPLAAMALTAIAANRAALGMQHIAGLSDRQRKALFKTLKSSQDLTLDLWGLFLLPNLAASDAVSGPAHLYCTQHRRPGNSLDPYLSVLRAPPHQFIAHIRITARLHADFGVPELMKLATLPHLGILEIIEVSPTRSLVPEEVDAAVLDANQVSDRLIRGWSLTQPSPFPALRVLRLWGCAVDMLTPACLQYVAGFPQLAHFEVSLENSQGRPGAVAAADTWSRAKRTAAMFGWTGFSLGAQELQHRSSRDDDAGKSTSTAIMTLNKVEAQSATVDALHWASNLYSFLEQTGYDGSKAKHELLEEVVAVGREAKQVSRGSFALVGLGRDELYGSLGRALQAAKIFCFVRTAEALATRASLREQPIGGRDHVSDVPDVHTHPASRGTDTGTSQLPPAKKRRKGLRTIGSMLDDFTG